MQSSNQNTEDLMREVTSRAIDLLQGMEIRTNDLRFDRAIELRAFLKAAKRFEQVAALMPLLYRAEHVLTQAEAELSKSP